MRSHNDLPLGVCDLTAAHKSCTDGFIIKDAEYDVGSHLHIPKAQVRLSLGKACLQGHSSLRGIDIDF